MLKKLFVLLFILIFAFNIKVYAKNNFSADIPEAKSRNHLTNGCFKGSKYPLNSFNLDFKTNTKFKERIDKKYPYLKKALTLNKIQACGNKKYIFIYDKSLNKKEFDSVKFYIPKDTKFLKITQITDPFEAGSLTYELFLYKREDCINKINASSTPKRASMKSLLSESYEDNGIIMKSVEIDAKNYDSGLYVISNYGTPKNYAIIFEFENAVT